MLSTVCRAFRRCVRPCQSPSRLPQMLLTDSVLLTPRSSPARCRERRAGGAARAARLLLPRPAPQRLAARRPETLLAAQTQAEPSARRRLRRAAAAATDAGVATSSENRPLLALVDGAMLAACSALCYHGAATFRLESYLGAFFPLPVVLAAARWGAGSAVKTLASAPFTAVQAPAHSAAGDHVSVATSARRPAESRHVFPAPRCARACSPPDVSLTWSRQALWACLLASCGELAALGR